ncbi:MAG: EAL and GGDEF domain-containing protein [Firmicutes bacterium]|nr:EAL and GGDEF domain-containing protein [Bacillota bacterium]
MNLVKNAIRIKDFLARLQSEKDKKAGRIDSVSTLPFLNAVFDDIAEYLSRAGKSCLFFIDISGFSVIERQYGQVVCETILKNIGRALPGMPIDFFGYRKKVAVCTMGGDDFLVFTDTPERGGSFCSEIERLHRVLEAYINKVNAEMNLNQGLEVHLGYTEVIPREDQMVESIVYTAVKEATQMAKGAKDFGYQARRLELQRIVFEREISMVYQPIVSLRNGQTLGFEALARGPSDSFFSSPANLFTFAEQHNLTHNLELLCREKAIESFRKNSDEKLFVNINPQVLNGSGILSLLQQRGIEPRNVVIELTERSAIIDHQQFTRAIDYYRRQGLMLAIDDVGTGYSNLQTVAELRPEYIKIDMSLVRGVNFSPSKKALLETMVNFAERINARLIAEGVETLEELKSLMEIGVGYGQGYLIARPSITGTPINQEAITAITDYTQKKRNYFSDLDTAIGELAIHERCIPPSYTVRQVAKIFEDYPRLYGLVVLDEGGIHGLMMRPKLFSMLGSQYGYALFMNRQVIEVLDPNPLMVSKDTPVSKVAQMVASRTDETLDDFIIITSGANYYGVVMVRRLLESMARIQIEQAKNSNPLTGLPGNLVIEFEMKQRLEALSVFSLLCFDLDNFKCFNDVYGFEHGDRVIKMTSDIIQSTVNQHGSPEDLVGHIGGDDFVIVTVPERAAILANEIIKSFDAEIPNYYSDEDRRRGNILAVNRRGVVQEIPIMSISVVHVNNKNRSITSYLEVGEIAAELKQLAKNRPGSIFCEDKRIDRKGVI